MENTTIYTKTVFMLTTSEFTTPEIIDIIDVDLAWHTDMERYATIFAHGMGYTAHDVTMQNYGRTVTFKAVHDQTGASSQWTITKSQPARFSSQVHFCNNVGQVRI